MCLLVSNENFSRCKNYLQQYFYGFFLREERLHKKSQKRNLYFSKHFKKTTTTKKKQKQKTKSNQKPFMEVFKQ